MHNAKMYCLSLHNNTLQLIKRMGYLPVGLGSDNFSKEWITRENIFKLTSDAIQRLQNNDLDLISFQLPGQEQHRVS